MLVAHSNSGGEVFRNLDKALIGDTISVDAGNQQHEYIIEFTTIAKEAGESPEVWRENAKWIAPTHDNWLTLVTC